jgi:hypothetical protein
VHMASNVTVLDSHGEYLTAYLGRYRDARFVHLPNATNHQEQLDWPAQAHAPHSVDTFASSEHEVLLRSSLASPTASGSTGML